jgi:hypothetical protein
MGDTFFTMKHGYHHKAGISPQHVEQAKGHNVVTQLEIDEAKSQAGHGNIGERVQLKTLRQKATER